MKSDEVKRIREGKFLVDLRGRVDELILDLENEIETRRLAIIELQNVKEELGIKNDVSVPEMRQRSDDDGSQE